MMGGLAVALWALAWENTHDPATEPRPVAPCPRRADGTGGYAAEWFYYRYIDSIGEKNQ